MNQYQWTFLDSASRRHTLGIAHSAASGHLVVHCDMRVLTIDFAVLEPKSYSFFVEDELCRLEILGSPEAGFTYKFDIDHEADTEINRARKLERATSTRRDVRRLSGIVATIVILLGGIAWWGYSAAREGLPERLRLEGLPAWASVDPASGAATFIADGRVVRGTPVGPDARRLEALRARVGARPDARTLQGRLMGDVGLPVLWQQGKPGKWVVDWETVFANVVDPDARALPAADYLAAGLTEALPKDGGSGTCALRAAAATGGYFNQLALVDAFLLGEPRLRTRWVTTFATEEYGATLRRVCPPPQEDPPADGAPAGSRGAGRAGE